MTARAMTNRRRQVGVSLLEVLISVLILGVTLLGIAAMQARALSNGQSSFENSQMVIHTYSILEAMRANRSAATSGAYNLTMTCSVPSAGGTLASADIRAWLESMKTGLSGPANVSTDTTTCGAIACTSSTCTVTVQWDDSRGRAVNASTAESATGTGSTIRQLVTVARL
ncbi:hypothetical protein A6R73_11635 [Xanthomonas translucens pv. poae]|uniref:Type IV pilus modification protein PilV n=1 Tax=Xanthomonas graminis pv. poae TaxID=227946 RepID=A0A199P6N9_9XANT|nr:type IV pilus modification protein PilV [Xanthomonas translucens]OAX56949.1 hypothetical protein A6R73_11635 [Xanthomonas translucens pv. poae]